MQLGVILLQVDSLRTKAIVLRRTNYGEADRILSVLTPEGKVSVMAKGVRKEKSKLAGGIELFSVSEVTLRRGRGELWALTSVRLLEFYGEIMKDLSAMEFVGGVLKEVSRHAEQVDAPEYFDLVWQVLQGTNEALKNGRNLELARVWWALSVARVGGEEVNLRLDVEGEELAIDKKYVWDGGEGALRVALDGSISADHIKAMRLMINSPLQIVSRVTGIENLMDEILNVVKYITR